MVQYNNYNNGAVDELRCGIAASDMSLRLFEKPLVITYSGGKDSDVLLHLARGSGIPFEVLHSLTTADAPETVRHVYDTFYRLECKGIKCDVDKHVQPDGSRMTMWKLIQKKLMPPTRLMRYCCAVLKEGGARIGLSLRVFAGRNPRPENAAAV